MSFTQIPSNNLVPGAYAEFDKSGAVQGDPAKPHRVLLVGTVPAASTGAMDTPTLVSSEAEVLGTWGKSPLAALAYGYFRKNRRVRTYAMAISEAAAGTAATGTITATGTATEDGTLTLRVNGVRIEVAVADGDAAADVHTAINAAIGEAITAYPYLLPISTEVSVTPDVTLTSLVKGTIGNAMTIEDIGDAVAGITIAVVDFASGAGSEDEAAAIAALGTVQYDTIGLATGLGSLSSWHTFAESQWDAMTKQDCLVLCSSPGAHATLTTLGDANNSPYVSIFGTGASPTPAWVATGNIVGGEVVNPDSARPRFGLTLPDVVPPEEADRFTADERQLLLESGISTFRVGASGAVSVERLITTYTQDDTTGAPDPVYRNVSTMRNLSYLRWSWNTRLEARYSGFNLADDGTQFDPSASVVTPSVIRGEALAWFRSMESAGRVEDFDGFREALLVQRNADDAERIDVISPPDLINELVTTATRFAFRH